MAEATLCTKLARSGRLHVEARAWRASGTTHRTKRRRTVSHRWHVNEADRDGVGVCRIRGGIVVCAFVAAATSGISNDRVTDVLRLDAHVHHPLSERRLAVNLRRRIQAIEYVHAAHILLVRGPVSYTHLRAHETGRNLVC